MREEMSTKIKAGEAIDISDFPRLKRGHGELYVLDFDPSEVDLCDPCEGRWMKSAGKRKTDGAMVAATDYSLFDNPEYECLWCR